MLIPEIRKKLSLIADHIEEHSPLSAKEIRECVEELKRRPAERKAPVTSEPMSQVKASEIRAIARKFPMASQAWIAERCNVNAGRVSEALRGKRK